jgi:division protein 1
MSLDAVPEEEANSTPSLIRGFKATVPSSELPKQRRRMIRGGLMDADMGYEKIGLKKLGDRARGLLTEGDEAEEGSLGVGRKSRRKRRERGDARKREGKLHLEDLVKQADEIAVDKENLNVRTVSFQGSPGLS